MSDADEFKNSLKERIANPLVFSFVISFCVYNWEVLAHLLLVDLCDLVMNSFMFRIVFMIKLISNINN